MRKCQSCQKDFTTPPKDAHIKVTGGPLDGFYWDCCDNVIFMPLSDFRKQRSTGVRYSETLLSRTGLSPQQIFDHGLREALKNGG